MTDSCNSAQTTVNQDFNTYNCTLAATGSEWDANNNCWTTPPPAPASLKRSVTCYVVGTNGTTLTEVTNDNCKNGNVPVYLVNSTDPTLSTAQCSPATDGETLCEFLNKATIDDVNTTAQCTGCASCQNYVIGVGPFAFTS